MSLELESTDDLINELHRRSTVFIYAMRPLVKAPDQQHDFVFGCSADGGKQDAPERVARGLGLMQIAGQLMVKRGEEKV